MVLDRKRRREQNGHRGGGGGYANKMLNHGVKKMKWKI